MIPFGYVFLAIFIWVIWQHRKTYKINKRDVIIVIITILLMGLLGLRYYMLSSDTLKAVMNTSYPGERFEIGGDGTVNIWGYIYNIFTPYKDTTNPCESSTMISFYPIPVIIAIIYMIRNKKGYSFIIPLTLLSVLFSVWTFCQTNEMFAKITLLYMVKAKRITIPLGLIQSYFIIYVLGHIEKKDIILKDGIAKIVAMFSTVAIMYVALKYFPSEYVGSLLGCVAGVILVTAIYLMFNLKEHNKKELIIFLIIYSLACGLTVNPIIKGTDIIYETSLAKKVQEIVENDSEGLWIVDSYGAPISNYITANGARTLNCTNYYPNLDLISTIFGNNTNDEQLVEIYNRYAHISVNITKEESNLQFIVADSYAINLNYKKLIDLDVKYVLSDKELSDYSDDEIQFVKLDNIDGFMIYEVVSVK